MSGRENVIPVVDIFCGAGGLGEGFFAVENERSKVFDVALSIDNDTDAIATLRLRKFFHQFPTQRAPDEYYNVLRATESGRAQALDALKAAFPAEWEAASSKCLKLTLRPEGPKDEELLDKRIEEAISSNRENWILVGGPPCQAYSTAGRARNRARSGYKAEDDERHFLYEQYLRIIAKYWPRVVIMENVTGILDSRVGGEKIFRKITKDLSAPGAAVRDRLSPDNDSYPYQIRPLVEPQEKDWLADLFGVHGADRDFIIHCEKFGVPQRRSRVILMAVRGSSGSQDSEFLEPLKSRPITVQQTLSGMPRLRSKISRGCDSDQLWLDILTKGKVSDKPWFDRNKPADDKRSDRGHRQAKNWFRGLSRNGSDMDQRILEVVANIKLPRSKSKSGDTFVRGTRKRRAIPEPLGSWIVDEKLGGFCNHMTREHMPSDLFRYLFYSAFAEKEGRSPKLTDEGFPDALKPKHKNVHGGHFADRFRVQLAEEPASTIMSHIRNDGHYYIHYDPTQCRSLTPREAARLQSFPDNYFFCGGMGSQFRQIGNAVPPLLAWQIAKVVARMLGR